MSKESPKMPPKREHVTPPSVGEKVEHSMPTYQNPPPPPPKKKLD